MNAQILPQHKTSRIPQVVGTLVLGALVGLLLAGILLTHSSGAPAPSVHVPAADAAPGETATTVAAPPADATVTTVGAPAVGSTPAPTAAPAQAAAPAAPAQAATPTTTLPCPAGTQRNPIGECRN